MRERQIGGASFDMDGDCPGRRRATHLGLIAAKAMARSASNACYTLQYAIFVGTRSLGSPPEPARSEVEELARACPERSKGMTKPFPIAAILRVWLRPFGSPCSIGERSFDSLRSELALSKTEGDATSSSRRRPGPKLRFRVP